MTDLNKKLEKKLQEQTRNMKAIPLSELPDPSEMKNLIKGAKKIIDLLMEGKRGILIGDYDVDGIMASAIVMGFMDQVGFSREIFDVHIPSRLKDGYGLSANVVKKAIDEGYDFIVTVDNGIAAVEAIQMAKDAGLSVIVTDHHTAPKVLPNADILICPKQPGETFPYIEISGATVAWYLVAAMKAELKSNINIAQWLDYVALTIMSDVMPLDHINLSLLEAGLKQIKSRKRYIYQLVWKAEWTHQNEIDETALSFGIVPMFNAVGRIDDANLALDLLLSKDKRVIFELFKKVKTINERRKKMSRENTYDAEKIVDNEIKVTDNVVFVKGQYHEGVVGIIAGRLAEKYKRPAYVMSWNEEKEVWKGSARTSGDVHLYDITNEATEILAGFGGHAGAVGFSVEEKNVSSFKKSLVETTKDFPEEKFINKFLEPIQCKLSDINEETFNIVRNHGPYGQSNPLPRFIAKVIITDTSSIPRSNGLHWKVKLQVPGSEYKFSAMMFNVHPSEVSFDSGIELKKAEEPIEVELQLSNSYDAHNEEYKQELFASFIY